MNLLLKNCHTTFTYSLGFSSLFYVRKSRFGPDPDTVKARFSEYILFERNLQTETTSRIFLKELSIFCWSKMFLANFLERVFEIFLVFNQIPLKEYVQQICHLIHWVSQEQPNISPNFSHKIQPSIGILISWDCGCLLKSNIQISRIRVSVI